MEFAWRLPGIFFDLRVIVGLFGGVLSVIMHELLHIIVHWGEINSISLFPDHNAIVEITFTPAAHYNLAVEEAAAYLVTMVTLILTAMLMYDIHTLRDTRSVRQVLGDISGDIPHAHDDEAIEHLGRILGVHAVGK